MTPVRARVLRGEDDLELEERWIEGELQARFVDSLEYTQFLIDGTPVAWDEDLEEKALRRVRTAAGARHFDLPIGAVIRPAPPVLDLPNTDVADWGGGDPPADAEIRHLRTSVGRDYWVLMRLPDDRDPDDYTMVEISKRYVTRRALEQAIKNRSWPKDLDLAPVGETEEAKKVVKSIAQRILEGVDPEQATKDYKKELHREKERIIRARKKAAKLAADAQQADESLAVEVDAVESGEADFVQKLADVDDVDPAVLADLGLEAGELPKALYSWNYAVHGLKKGPGAVSPLHGGPWYDRIGGEDTEPIPVIDLQVINGYRVKRGVAQRILGVNYLAEIGDDETEADALERIKAAQKVTEGVLASVPNKKRLHQRGVALLNGPNPADAYWAETYKMPGFVSRAIGGRGGTTFFSSREKAVLPTDIAHEFGHNVDTETLDGDLRMTDESSWVQVHNNELLNWKTARENDWHAHAHAMKLDFVQTRPGNATPIGNLDVALENAVTSYGKAAPAEDFAESVRLYLKDRREGKLGYLKPTTGTIGTNVRFVDLWPNRARLLDYAFGTDSDYNTELHKRRMKEAEADQLARLKAGQPTTTAYLAELHGLSNADAAAATNNANSAHLVVLKAEKHAELTQSAEKHIADALKDPDVVVHLNLNGTLPAANSVGWLNTAHNNGVLSVQEVTTIWADALNAAKQDLQYKAAEQLAEKSAAEAAALQQATPDITLLPKDKVKLIRKRKAWVKYKTKKAGASIEDAQKAADEYEEAAILEAMQELGLVDLDGNWLDKNAGVTGASPGDLVKAGHVSAGKKGNTFLNKAGQSNHPLSKGGYAGYGAASQAKSNIAAELGSRLNNKDDWELARVAATHFHNVGMNEDFDALTEAERQSRLDSFASTLVQNWASTAGDVSLLPLCMQRAIKEEFGLKADWGQRMLAASSHGYTSSSIDSMKDQVVTTYPTVGPFMRRFARVMYEHTQEMLQAEGISVVNLWRGMGSHGASWGTAGTHRVPLQPANSWSSNKGTAKSFAGYHQAVLLKAVVPISRILGTARTGFGCLNESEFVVLDSDGLVEVIPKDYPGWTA